jgi:hypothetical protein
MLNLNEPKDFEKFMLTEKSILEIAELENPNIIKLIAKKGLHLRFLALSVILGNLPLISASRIFLKW